MRKAKDPDAPHIVHIKNYMAIINRIIDKKFENRQVSNIIFPNLSINNTKEFVHTVNLVHKHITHMAKCEHIKKAIAKRNDNFINNPKIFFRKIVTGYDGKRAWIMDEDGNSYTDTHNKLRIQTQIWKELYNKPSQPKNLDPWYPRNSVPPTILLQNITTEEYQEALGCSYKCPGPSNITFEILKELPEATSLQIIDQLNSILNSETIPESWRLANITLLPRDSNTSYLPQMYRPISLLDTLYKTLSAILHLRLSRHVVMHRLISRTQSGYTKGVSTVDNIITLNNIIEDSIQNNK